MASDIFESFPRVNYTLDNGETLQIVTDLFKRVILSKELKENNSFFETYEVLHGETPEEISYRFYGTQTLHWLILMVNDIIDPRFNWPVSEENLILLTSKKYGGDESVFSTAIGKDAKGYRVETFFILTEDSTHKNPIRLTAETSQDNPTKIPVAYADSDKIVEFESNYEIEEQKNESYRNIKILKAEIIPDIVQEYRNLLTV
jgi:hypothetical protein